MKGFKLDAKSARFIFILASLGVFLILLAVDIIFIAISRPLVTPGFTEGSAGPVYQPDPLLTRIPGLEEVIKSPILGSSDPVLGEAAAPVEIFIFSDFTCGYCANQEIALRELLDAYPGKLRLIWKDYPEKAAATLSWQAAIAARCAQAQGAFWPMHDLIFAKKELKTADFGQFAERLGLARSKFRQCIDAQQPRQLLLDDMLEADTLGIDGVPFIFINGKEFMGEVGLPELKAAVEAELKKIKR